VGYSGLEIKITPAKNIETIRTHNMLALLMAVNL
jgi:hypothetical protein